MAGLAANWYRVLAPRGLVVLQVLRLSPTGQGQPTLEELRNWGITHNSTYPVVRDPGDSLAHLQGRTEATTIVIDRHQQIRFQGDPSPEELLELLQQLLIHED